MEDIGVRIAIEARAEALATKYGGPPVDLDAIAGTVGIFDISFGDIDESAALFAGPIDGTWGVLVRRDDPFVRRRFSIAHEIAHVALGIFKETAHVYRSRQAARAEKNAAERTCDYFAACLLMPRAWIVQRVPRGTSATELARAFDVSLPAMRARLHELGLHALAGAPKDPAAVRRRDDGRASG